MGLKTADIVRILQLRGMGRKTAKRFCELAFSGNTQDLIDQLIEVGANKLLPRFPIYTKEEISEAFYKGDHILEKSEQASIAITSIFDGKFPSSLALIPDPPLVINTKGSLNDLSVLTGVAVIGTRQPSAAGIKAGEYFGKQLALKNYNIVSGLAIGCDAAGHRGSLSVDGFTTAILAHGLHTVYPKENRMLAEEILEKGGVLLSEYFIGVGALANFFVERDRLQAGLSEATIVVQTDEKGGTMHAVKATIASGKNLAAIKYKGTELEYSKTKGNEMLIREGKAFALTSDNLPEFIRLFSKGTPLLQVEHPVQPELIESIPILPKEAAELSTTPIAKASTISKTVSKIAIKQIKEQPDKRTAPTEKISAKSGTTTKVIKRPKGTTPEKEAAKTTEAKVKDESNHQTSLF